MRCFCGSRLQPILSLFFLSEECFYCTSCLAKLNIQCIVMSSYGVCMPRSFYSIEIGAWINGIKDILTNDLASSEPRSHVLEWLLLRIPFSNVSWVGLQKQMCWKRVLYVNTTPVSTTGSNNFNMLRKSSHHARPCVRQNSVSRPMESWTHHVKFVYWDKLTCITEFTLCIQLNSLGKTCCSLLYSAIHIACWSVCWEDLQHRSALNCR